MKYIRFLIACILLFSVSLISSVSAQTIDPMDNDSWFVAYDLYLKHLETAALPEDFVTFETLQEFDDISFVSFTSSGYTLSGELAEYSYSFTDRFGNALSIYVQHAPIMTVRRALDPSCLQQDLRYCLNEGTGNLTVGDAVYFYYQGGLMAIHLVHQERYFTVTVPTDIHGLRSYPNCDTIFSEMLDLDTAPDAIAQVKKVLDEKDGQEPLAFVLIAAVGVLVITALVVLAVVLRKRRSRLRASLLGSTRLITGLLVLLLFAALPMTVFAASNLRSSDGAVFGSYDLYLQSLLSDDLPDDFVTYETIETFDKLGFCELIHSRYTIFNELYEYFYRVRDRFDHELLIKVQHGEIITNLQPIDPSNVQTDLRFCSNESSGTLIIGDAAYLYRMGKLSDVYIEEKGRYFTITLPENADMAEYPECDTIFADLLVLDTAAEAATYLKNAIRKAEQDPLVSLLPVGAVGVVVVILAVWGLTLLRKHKMRTLTAFGEASFSDVQAESDSPFDEAPAEKPESKEKPDVVKDEQAMLRSLYRNSSAEEWRPKDHRDTDEDKDESDPIRKLYRNSNHDDWKPRNQ